ncbi:unnamed protein product, partial [Prorocentrum cordatum]
MPRGGLASSPLRWRLWHRSPWGGGLSLGPLAFALPLAHRAAPLPWEHGARPAGFPAEVRDEELVATEPGAWAYALALNGSVDAEPSVRLSLPPGRAEELAFATGGACPLVARVAAVRWAEWAARGDAPLLTTVLPDLRR